MPVPLQPSGAGQAAVSRPLVACLFVSSVPPLGRLLVHDAAGHGALPVALVLVPGVARRPVGPRPRGLARRRDRVPPRAADRRLRRHRRRLDRLLLRQPPHLVRLARAAGHDRARPLRPADRGGRQVAGAPDRRDRRGPEARPGARRDDVGREGPRLHLASHGPGPLPRARPRGRGARGGELRQRLPGGPGPGPALHRLRPARQPRAPDGRAPPGVADGPRRLPDRPRAARPDGAAAARIPPGVRRDPVDRGPRHAAREGRAARGACLLRLRRPGRHEPGGPGDRLHGALSGPDQPSRPRLHPRRLHRHDRLPARVRLGPLLLRRPRGALGEGGRRARRGGRAGLRPRPAAQGLGERPGPGPRRGRRPSATASGSSCCSSPRGGSPPPSRRRAGGSTCSTPACTAPSRNRCRRGASPSGRRRRSRSATSPLPGGPARVQSAPCRYRLSTG